MPTIPANDASSSMPPMPNANDPAANAPMMDAPTDGTDMGENMPMDDMSAGEDNQSEGGDATIDIINKLSDTDKEAVRAYAESMLNRDENQNGDDEGMDPAMGMGEEDPNGGNAPMMESIVFTKAQIRRINENFGPTEDELTKDEIKPLNKKATAKVSRKSPFNNPRFK